MESPISHQTVHVIETIIPMTKSLESIFRPFAMDEFFLQDRIQDCSYTIAHFWELDQVVILGMTDTKTPHLLEGIQTLQQQQFIPIVRHAGGLAVVSNAGVLNMSLIFSSKGTSIRQAYEWMKELIERAFPEASGQNRIEAFEVSDSYCPGDFDLSIRGKKFAGIAQRRFKDAVCVSIYLSVTGNQLSRGNLIRDFYNKSVQGETTRWHFPNVNPASMENLETLLNIPLTTELVKQRLQLALSESDCTLIENEEDYTTTQSYQKAMARLQQRMHLLTKES